MKKYYTTAPTDYDYSYTKTESVLGEYKGEQIRVVTIPDEYADYQLTRYSSGLYLATSDLDFVQYLIQSEAEKRT